ncbi:putative sugar phosphate/phosphate translocator-like, partial [Capsicum annuum]
MSNSISIANVSDRNLVDRLLRQDVADNSYGQNSRTMSNSNYHQRLQQVHGIANRHSPYDHSSTRQHHTSVDHPYNEPYVTRHQGATTLQNNDSGALTGAHTGYSRTITISDLVGFLLRPDVADNSYGRSSQNWGNLPDYSQSTNEQIDDHEVIFIETYMEEEDEDALLRYFQTRTHCVAAPTDGLNNSTETEEICPICQAEFKQEETIGTLGCGHEYHTGCIKQWLLRKKDCPMCRASVLPFTST